MKLRAPGRARPDSADSSSGRLEQPYRFGRVLLIGLVATAAAMAATTLVAALARATGADFEIPDGGESIPLAGFAVVTGGFSLVGVGLALALLRWSSRPARRFVWTTVLLTAASLVPALLSGGTVATACSLVLLHLVAASVVVPALGWALGGRVGR